MPVPTPADAARLAGAAAGPRALRPLLDTVLTALAEGAAARSGPLPAGGPDAVTRRLTELIGPTLPTHGTGPHDALRTLVTALAEGAADPADPHCAAHLHAPPLAVAVAADLAAAALNPSMDSWDQAPAASALEHRLARDLARLVHPQGPDPDALVTTGGTEANLIAALLARENLPAHLTLICGANAHHSVHRAAWLLGLPAPTVLPTPRGLLDPAAVHHALTTPRPPHRPHAPPALVIATAGTTDSGAIDPLHPIADIVAAHRPHRPTALHVDAAYGGPLLLSPTHRAKLTGLDRADTVTLDLHKLGWQPVAAGLLTTPDRAALTPLAQRADYLNAEDDTQAGLPDLLGRSLRTTRRPDILKIAATLRALGTSGLAELVDRTCRAAADLADLVAAEPRLTLHAPPTISTVLFRPAGATDQHVAAVRRRLLTEGRAVLGRARAHGPDGRPALWLKATLLNPFAQPNDLAALVKLVLDQDPEHADDRPTHRRSPQDTRP
ncbi:pyridoxal phosphate-dependent decarboxylase family protein [Streptomyces marincola]|uniref:pyridoxal phosphate-dependent decarboxylase family protein n=1 Tax=Streptomyces marincola TaxID=2878388 RepID=UPI001CF3B1C0|nr:pyridoxal-dependent decarboxylase [Streptomyces marincola]UCM87308.1 aspartate aminotransferase family protein [Streptomyces marincola]